MGPRQYGGPTDRDCVEAILNGGRDGYRDLGFRYSGTVFRVESHCLAIPADASVLSSRLAQTLGHYCEKDRQSICGSSD
jgi:hypothetical protein